MENSIKTKQCCGYCKNGRKEPDEETGVVLIVCEWNKKPSSVYLMKKERMEETEGEDCVCWEE